MKHLKQKREDESRVMVLIDNREHPQFDLEVEHGLSFYIEVGEKSYLFDVGATDAYYNNAKKLGINLEEVDALFISHGHKDHTGGLPKFMEINKKAKVYLSHHLKQSDFYSNRWGQNQNITMPKNYSNIDKERFVFIKENIILDDCIELFTSFTDKHSLPLGNKTLYKEDSENGSQLDTFDHEIAIKLNLKQGIIVLSSCTHNGLLNTLETMIPEDKRESVLATIGGAHLLDDCSHHTYESKEEIAAIAAQLNKLYLNMQLITGHCTGNEAIKTFKEVLGGQFESFYSGWYGTY